jgi:hypothetical protein
MVRRLGVPAHYQFGRVELIMHRVLFFGVNLKSREATNHIVQWTLVVC